MKGIDSLEFNTLSGLGSISEADRVAYFISVKNSGFTSPSTLSVKLQGGRNWAQRENKTDHPLWKYADIANKQDYSASNKAINADLAKYNDQIFKGAPMPSSQPTTTSNSGSGESSEVATASVGGNDLLSSKNLKIAGGAAAALALGYVLLK